MTISFYSFNNAAQETNG